MLDQVEEKNHDNGICRMPNGGAHVGVTPMKVQMDSYFPECMVRDLDR